MAKVDPDDDGIRRYVVHHYRYDPERHERRHLVVGAFDNETEYLSCLQEVSAELSRQRAAGELADLHETVSGIVHEPGHRQLEQNARLLHRAGEHGVVPPDLDDLDLPAHVQGLRSETTD